ncbi:MAG: bifunctional nuclease family protein [Candidatus Omnitrophota bacterium]
MRAARIYSVIFIPALAQYVVTLEETDGSRLLPIWVGAGEGTFIAAALEGEKFIRPLTHDLAVSLIGSLGGKIEKVVICDVRDNAYYASIFIKKADRTLEIDSRPSDAMALAVRTNSPIFIEEKVLELCPVINKPITGDEVKAFEKEMENLHPEEFFKKLDEDGGRTESGME